MPRYTARQKVANFFKLHMICEDTSCRRSQRCRRDQAPRIIRYKQHYQEFLPDLRAALIDRMGRIAAERGERPRK